MIMLQRAVESGTRDAERETELRCEVCGAPYEPGQLIVLVRTLRGPGIVHQACQEMMSAAVVRESPR